MNSKLSDSIAEYFKDKDGVIAVYLFGSYAEGTERNMSDMDIGVILDESNSEFRRGKRNSYMVDLARRLKKDIHLVVLNSTNEELHAQIFKKGKCLLVNDSKKLAQYKMHMFARIADFAYYKKQMQKGMINKVMEA